MKRPGNHVPSKEQIVLRDPAIATALDAAIASGDRDLYALLCRHSGLPGPQPNFGLATALGDRIATYGRRADPLVREMCSLDDDRAPPGTVMEFLPICGAVALAARYRAGVDPKGALEALYVMADDVRHLVRGAVVVGLRQISGAAGPELVASLARWMDGYLNAAVAIEALADRAVLDRIGDGEAIVLRLDEAFTLAEEAPRSHERTQGYRTLVRTLAASSPVVMARFAAETAAWLEKRAAAVKVPELREAIETAVAKARSLGHGGARVEGITRALEASAPPRRDPTTYVGPTRGRGKKAKARRG